MTRTLTLALAGALSLSAVSASAQSDAPATPPAEPAPAEPAPATDQLPEEDLDVIVVTGESEREVVETLGKAITRTTRAGRPVARFEAPLCVKVSGMPDGMADVVRERIYDNVRSLRGLSVDEDADCDPNAFVGVMNDVTEAVDRLRKEEAWLFEGLLSYQIKRIYQGSDAVRAWHVFNLLNRDGTAIPGARPGNDRDIGSLINNTGRASRLSQLRNDLSGAVVLIETAALADVTFRQMADYATFRILASVSDEVDTSQTSLPTILTLFGPGSAKQNAPRDLTEFDKAYLESLYELPRGSRDGQVVAAAVSRFIDQLEAED